MTPTPPSGPSPDGPPPGVPRPPRAVRIRTLLILVAVVVTLALGLQVAAAAWRLLDQADKIRDDSVTGNKAGVPSYMVLEQMQAERRLTAVRLGGGQVSQQDLEKQRAATDQANASFQHLSSAELPASDRYVYDYVVMVKDKLVGLQEQRRLADSRTGDPQKVLDFYTAAIDQMIRLYQEMSNMDDGGLTYETRPMVGLMHAFEALSREDALIALAGPNRVLTEAQYAEFARNVGVQRFVYGTWVAPYLPAKDKAMYDALVGSPGWAAQTRIEDQVVAQHKTSTNGLVTLPASIQEWQAAREPVRGQTTGLNISRVSGLLDNTFGKAAELRHRAWWLAGFSAAAVLVIVIMVVLIIRTVLRRTNALRKQALSLAEERLPDIVTAFQRGEEVDTADLPCTVGAKDEIGQIGDAVAVLARQASDGAELVYRERQGFERFAEGVTGRSVVLVGVQLRLLDDLMRERDQDVALISKLYGLDHQTVRLRRQIENLQVLSGGVIANPHEEPAHIANLLMDAAGEAAGHERVEKHFLADARVIPSAASELTHVLAELIENGARYSPPDFKVVVRAQPAVHGVTVEIEDRGVGLSPEQYEALNARLGHVPLYAEMAENAAQLGLFVVGRLSARLGLEVTLRRSVYGGTSAVVLIPRSLLAGQGGEPAAAAPAAEATPGAPKPLPIRRPAAAAQPEPAHAHAQDQAHARSSAPGHAQPYPQAHAQPYAEPFAFTRGAADVPAPRGGGRAADAAGYRPVADAEAAPLPKRSRGSHLAEQLRDDTPAAAPAAYAPDSPEAARDMYRGLQAAFDHADHADHVGRAGQSGPAEQSPGTVQPGRLNHPGRADGDPQS
ncbi:sensor histidine kinase [Yinghuangia soli]|uniref:histidine kinase n=1 Tax=Yinghuangia soli TaxID=2908204 RepID=A0AA41Q3I7_9ACTN|nr:ATP-binding protein [Yinghuangia soli]MCF2529749.1 nitrate- and nitrite sensing domain-containing protein [Yinghuangia soli]